MNDFEEVVSQLRTAVLAAGNDPAVSDSDLRDILAFLVKVTQVVDQSFQDIYALAVELAYLESSEVDGARIKRLQMELELLTARSHYRESLEICSRLKHLSKQFNDHIRSAVSGLKDSHNWQQIFWLIEDREGRIIRLVESSANNLRYQLDQVRQGDVRAVNREARRLADELRPLLNELREMTNDILGLSGRQGFIELTRDRAALQQATNTVIHTGDMYMARDIYSARNAGAMGPNATATNTTITENYGADLDFEKLAAELALLKQAMMSEIMKEAGKTEHLEAVAAVSAAEDAARRKESSGVFEKLKVAGGWALDTATKIGVAVATETIKKSMGL